MSGWGWLNLIWIIPLGALYLLIPFGYIMIFFHNINQWRKVRKIHTQLYEDIFNECVLCPKCRGLVYVGVWEKHLKTNHRYAGHTESIEKEFEKALKNL